MKIYKKRKIYDDEIVHVDKLVGVPKRPHITVLCVPEPARDLLRLSPADFDLEFAAGRRHFETLEMHRTEWVPVRRVGDIEEGFRRVYVWSTLNPDQKTFRRPKFIPTVTAIAIALVGALGCTPGPPPAKPYVNPCLECHVTEPEVSRYQWSTFADGPHTTKEVTP